MKGKSIRFVVLLAVVALVAVVVMQFFWVNQAIHTQNEQIETQEKNLQTQEALFNDAVRLALIGVRDQLVSLNLEASEFYLEPVKQINTNYYVVSFYDTINPKLLESFLIDEFEQHDILETFEYGIYDCFYDSIIYDKYVGLSQNQNTDPNHIEASQEKWDHDGHYFGVYFPDREKQVLPQHSNISSTLILSSIVILMIVSALAYAISVILQQKRLSEVKTDFINNMTHELKTPISTIGLSAEVLAKDDIVEHPERIKQYAKIIQSENQRLENQVERVLQLAKLEKDKLNLVKSVLDVHELIREVQATFAINVKERNGSLSLRLNAENSNIEADPVHLSSVISNLLDNANKYSPEQPQISITSENQPGSILLHIQDHGKGMSKEEVRNIFDKFYRAPTGNLHDVKGFGLGLFYVKSIIDAHHGTVTVKSTPGKGSTFTLLLKTL